MIDVRIVVEEWHKTSFFLPFSPKYATAKLLALKLRLFRLLTSLVTLKTIEEKVG